MSEVKFGMLLSAPMPSLDRVMRIAEMSENSGMKSLAIPDHTLMVPPGFTPNALALLSVLAVKTKTAMLGTGVTDFARYHPSLLAQYFATLDHLSNGRVFLGVGAGEAMNIRPFGIDWDRPYTILREGIEIVKRLWRGEKFSYEGKKFRLENAFLQIKPLGDIPVYVGANGMKTRELVGEMCEGWMPIAETPGTYRKNLKDVKRGCEKAGRSIKEVDAALQIYTAIDEDPQKAMQRARQFAGVIVSAAEKAEQAGYEIQLPDGVSKKYYFEQLLLEDEMLMQFVKMSNLVTDEMIRDFFIVGTPEECSERIEEFVKAGVRHFMLINIGPDPKYVLKVYAEKIIPSFG